MSEKIKDDFVQVMESPIVLPFHFTAGRAVDRFLRGCKEGKLYGQRSPVTGKVIVPPRGSCPESGMPTVGEVELKDTGTVMSFTIVNIPIPGNPIQPPYIIANVMLDGADQAFIHLVSGCNNADIQIGTRLKAVWKDKKDWDYSLENIAYFTPNGEAPKDIDQLRNERAEAVKQFLKGGKR
jgi:uncharacterized OB-fold protein